LTPNGRLEKPTFFGTGANVGFGPQIRTSPQRSNFSSFHLFDDLVGAGEERLGDHQADCFGNLEVDDKVEIVGGLLMWWTAPAPGDEVPLG
jgi:hypothetical protein